MKPSRLETLSDGIFAIVMTLLVLDLKVAAGDPSHITEHVLALWPGFLSFIVSFVILAIYWGAHHILFSRLKEVNFNFIWLNMLFLLSICFVPFSSGLLGTYPLEGLSQQIYAANLLLCGGFVYALFSYAIRHYRLVDPERISDEFMRNAKGKILLPPILYLLGGLCAFINTHISIYFLSAGPLIYFLPIDSHAWQLLMRPLTGKH